ncbi:MAG TPA: sterol desaturase family protein [Opitutaceae bacterium]|nr:sterol desaturase family protein [Opitutaceae bacterium]
MPSRPLERILSYLWWPLLLGLCVTCLAVGMARGQGPLFFNAAYAALALTLFVLERRFPHERQWLESDGQFWPDLLHTTVSKGLVQLAVVGGTTLGINLAIGERPAAGFWPVHWPMAAQVALGLVIAEFGLYWAHRLGHEWPWLWRFHAVHHSSTRLWFFNTGRFHFVDTFKSIVLGLPLVFLAGAPGSVFVWISGITAYIGMLTHCNVEMRFGPLNYIFNTPGLHRWHHSTDLREGNTNYGENLMLFDLMLGTFFDESRRPPARIGISEAMPETFLGQLQAPFVWHRYRAPAAKPVAETADQGARR